MPPKAGRRSKRAVVPPSSSSSSTSSDSSSSSSSDEGVVAVVQSAKTSTKDSASENRDWDLSSLDQSREGSPAPSVNHQSEGGSPAQSPTADTLPPTSALGPVGSDEKYSPAFGPVGDDEKHPSALVPVGNDEEHSSESHTAQSRLRSKPASPGKDQEDECFVVDAEGRRVTEVAGNSPVTLAKTPPPKKRAAIEGESGFLFTPIKTPPLPSSAPTNTPPRGNSNPNASGNASANAKTNASDNASVNANSLVSGNASGNASSNASDDASVHARNPGGNPKGADARSSKGSPPPAKGIANASGNASARISTNPKTGSPPVTGGAAANPQNLPQSHHVAAVGEICLTPEAAQISLEIQSGERDLFLPLDCSPSGELQLQQLIEELQTKAEEKLGGILPRARAVVALEVARYAPDSDGWPDVEKALLLLKKRDWKLRAKGEAQATLMPSIQPQAAPSPITNTSEIRAPAASKLPISQSQREAADPVKGETAAGDKRMREQEQKIAALETQLRASQVCADAQKQLLEIRSDQLGEMREKAAVLLEQRELQDGLLLSLQQADAQPRSKFSKLEDPGYATRLEYLVGRGNTFENAMDALEATKQDGLYSSGRAEAHLNAALDFERKRLLQKANEAAKKMGDMSHSTADLPEIEEHSALGYLLDKHDDAIDIVLKVREVHAKSRAKAMHSAKNVLSAAHLVEQASIKSDSTLSRKGHDFLSKVALAVSEDCVKCKDLREKLEQEARWAKEREKAAAEKAKAEAEKLAKEKEERRKLEAEKHKPKPFVLNFKPEDSKRDVTLPRGFCGTCDKGQDKVRGKWLYPCDRCKKGYHLTCTTLTLVSTRDSEYFACSTCLDELEQNKSTGVPQPNFQVLGQDMARRKAPKRGKAVGSQSDSPPAASGGGVAQPQAGGGAARNMFQTPPPPSITIAPHSGGEALHTRNGGFDGDRDFLQPKTGSNASKTNVQIKDYFMWDDVPKDWVPKTDSKTPGKEGKEETLPEHPEKGYGKMAYQNWRRRNVTARDVAQAGGGSLGPLSRSLSLEMRVCLGTQFHRDPAVTFLRPFPMSDDKSFDSWLDKDPAFEWMKKLDDKLLLELCDKKFGVKKNDLFLSKRYYNLPTTNSKGEVLYHVGTFNRWITEWQNELSELKVSGCSFEGIDLRQTLLNALAPNSMLHNEATVFKTESIHALIAHLRDWLMQEEEAATSLRNKQQSAIQNAQAAAGGAAMPANLLPSGTTASNTQQANVLMTQLVEQQQKILETLSAGALNPNPATGGKALPAHLKATEGNLCRCRGCNNTWNRGRKIPCFQGCKYADHPNYNKQCKTQDAPTQQKLTWAGFKEKFPSTTPPKGYLEWEAYVNARDKNKKGDSAK